MIVPGASSAVRAEPFVGQIMMTGTNFCPRGWAEANGQLLAVPQNDALFSLFGTMYGGDGRTTFGLPDLRGRVAISKGDGPGLTPRRQGSRGGLEQVTASAGSRQVGVGLPFFTVTYCVALVGIYPSRN
ncbi:MAG: phage tail protein [Rhizobiales bacterium]|nr:phage tail protein [Hyphomicrobiales bacterium]